MRLQQFSALFPDLPKAESVSLDVMRAYFFVEGTSVLNALCYVLPESTSFDENGNIFVMLPSDNFGTPPGSSFRLARTQSDEDPMHVTMICNIRRVGLLAALFYILLSVRIS